MELKGVITPIITIMDSNGEIDYRNMKKHINNLIENGVNGILFLGSIGEFYALDDSQKKILINFAVKEVNGRVPVLVGIGDTNIINVIELSKHCKNSGVDILVLISPYYFAPTKLSAFEYISKVSKNCDMPILLYNFPERSGNDLAPDLILNIVKENNNIIGVKDTVDNISHTRKIIQKVKAEFPNFCVFSGFDEYYLVNRIAGGDGVISGLTNIVPKLFYNLHVSYEQKDFKTVSEQARQISDLMAIYDVTDLFVTGIKAGVKARGLDISTFTNYPGIPLTNEQYEEVKDILASSIDYY
jgi:4-hydroxy-tetrahydrodipicolinate synthase